MNLDFVADDPLVFPQPVPQVMNSKDFMTRIQETNVPIDKIAIWFLGQNSWILKSGDGALIAIDPYLSDWCASKDTGIRVPKSRLLPVFIEPEDLEVDLVLISHSHPDHCDPYTLRRLGCKRTARFVAPWQCLPILAEAGIPQTITTLVHPRQKESMVFGDRLSRLEVTAVFALPTDATDVNHVGFSLRFSNGKVYYNTGDTAFNELVGSGLDARPDLMSVCINGGYHNLSHWEAARLAAAIKPGIVVPAHYDMMPHNIQSPHMFRKSLWEQAREIEYHRMDYYEAFYF